MKMEIENICADSIAWLMVDGIAETARAGESKKEVLSESKLKPFQQVVIDDNICK